MDENELVQWMQQIEARLDKLEAKPVVIKTDDECIRAFGNPPALPPAGPAAIPWKPSDELTWQNVSGAFAARYRKARGLVWVSGPHVQAMIDIADAINSQEGDPKQMGKKALDNFFADDFAAKAGFPAGLLSKQFFRYLKPPEEDGQADKAARQMRAQEAERRHQEAKERAEAEHAQRIAEKGLDSKDMAAIGELKTWLQDE